jgi:hypothetical protein
MELTRRGPRVIHTGKRKEGEGIMGRLGSNSRLGRVAADKLGRTICFFFFFFFYFGFLFLSPFSYFVFSFRIQMKFKLPI